jgi:hypothetical protein
MQNNLQKGIQGDLQDVSLGCLKDSYNSNNTIDFKDQYFISEIPHEYKW